MDIGYVPSQNSQASTQIHNNPTDILKTYLETPKSNGLFYQIKESNRVDDELELSTHTKIAKPL